MVIHRNEYARGKPTHNSHGSSLKAVQSASSNVRQQILLDIRNAPSFAERCLQIEKAMALGISIADLRDYLDYLA